jgi:two-component system, cell cycle response regulator DivK
MKAVPIIAVTSYALAGDEAKAEAAGCNAYVSKPFSPRALLAKVREYTLEAKVTKIHSGSPALRSSSPN